MQSSCQVHAADFLYLFTRSYECSLRYKARTVRILARLLAPENPDHRQDSGADANDRLTEGLNEGIDEGRLGAFSDRCFLRVGDFIRIVIVCIGYSGVTAVLVAANIGVGLVTNTETGH